jgi:dienelactone hydrolase
VSEAQTIAKRTVMHRVPGVDAVRSSADSEYALRDSGALVFDLYAPPRAPEASPPPVVVIVEGYPDPGLKAVFGCRFKEMGSTTSWARLIAASGMAAVAYTNVHPEPDLHVLLAHLRAHGARLGVDASRIGLFASSGHAPLALSLALSDARERIACAALAYPYTLDLDGATGVADAARTFGFVNACAGRGVDDFARDVPLLLVRAGGDELPGLNGAVDRFAARALAADLPLTLANVPGAPHAFELFDGGPYAAAAVEQVLAFLRTHVYAAGTTVNRG